MNLLYGSALMNEAKTHCADEFVLGCAIEDDGWVFVDSESGYSGTTRWASRGSIPGFIVNKMRGEAGVIPSAPAIECLIDPQERLFGEGAVPVRKGRLLACYQPFATMREFVAELGDPVWVPDRYVGAVEEIAQSPFASWSISRDRTSIFLIAIDGIHLGWVTMVLSGAECEQHLLPEG